MYRLCKQLILLGMGSGAGMASSSHWTWTLEACLLFEVHFPIVRLPISTKGLDTRSIPIKGPQKFHRGSREGQKWLLQHREGGSYGP